MHCSLGDATSGLGFAEDLGSMMPCGIALADFQIYLNFSECQTI